MLTLRPMTDEEFTVFRDEGIEDYAAERARNFGTTPEEEHETSVRQYAELLPEGTRSPRQRLWSVIDAAGTVVGSLWVEVHEERHRAFIFYIILGEAYRGRGYGRQALELLEAELRPLGVTQIGLNVFADNTVAQRLYERMGYRVTNQTMMKAIPPAPDQA